MAKQRSSFAKLQRDKAKKERAAMKRANRIDRKSPDDSEEIVEESTADAVTMVSGVGEPSPQELLKLIEDLHNRREAGTISEDDFEEAKVELFARLKID
ncbi:MAG: hypothetical protein ACRBK7_26925 [Acidimicrobiales bacterium]